MIDQFPTLYTVMHAKFTGVGEDSLGNDVETWDDSVEAMVIAIQSGQVENVNGYTSRVIADVDMAIPPGMKVSVRDRFTLPHPFNDQDIPGDKPYEVIAIEDGLGFHGWRPGYVVKLKRVTG